MSRTVYKSGRVRLVRSKREREAVKIHRDGREVCNLKMVAGKHIYWQRIEAMHTRQKGVCCLYGFSPVCPGALALDDATFEHEDGRGMGGSKRDDRIRKDGRRYNGVAHLVCNQWKGSRHIDYNTALQARQERGL